MELLLSKFKPLNHGQSSFSEHFFQLARKADTLLASVPDISEESLSQLHDGIKQNIKKCHILLGMPVWNGITKPDHTAILDLNNSLKKTNAGGIKVAKSFPVHACFYIFLQGGRVVGAIFGSSLLSSLSLLRQFDVDCAVTDTTQLESLHKLFRQLYDEFSIPISEWTPVSFLETNRLLENCNGVNRVSMPELSTVWRKRGKLEFLLPLKCYPKSNINACFGKGRLNTRTGVERKRPWYEIEMIVPSSVTAMPGYPQYRQFLAYTDDGWKYECKTSGDYSKNFRSCDDLKTLGVWIKGRMEEKGVLQTGEQITEDHLVKYGRDNISLLATNSPGIWLLDFSI